MLFSRLGWQSENPDFLKILTKKGPLTSLMQRLKALTLYAILMNIIIYSWSRRQRVQKL